MFENQIELAMQWREALGEDSAWDACKIGYGDDDHSMKYTRGGWTIQIYDKPHRKGGRYMHIYGWGPDDLVIHIPNKYDWAAMQDLLKVCLECGAVGETVRLGFAGRVCPKCRAELAPKVEYAGWTN